MFTEADYNGSLFNSIYRFCNTSLIGMFAEESVLCSDWRGGRRSARARRRAAWSGAAGARPAAARPRPPLLRLTPPSSSGNTPFQYHVSKLHLCTFGDFCTLPLRENILVASARHKPCPRVVGCGATVWLGVLIIKSIWTDVPFSKDVRILKLKWRVLVSKLNIFGFYL